MIYRAHLPGARRSLTRDPKRSQRVLGLVLWILFVATLMGISLR